MIDPISFFKMRGTLIAFLMINVVVGMELPRNGNLEYPKVFRSVPVKSNPVFTPSIHNGGARKRVLNHLDTPTFLDSNNSPSSQYGAPSQSYGGAPALSQSYDAPSTTYVFGQPSPPADAYNAPPPSNSYESPSPSVSYSSSDISGAYNSPSSNSYNSPPAPSPLSTSYGSPPSPSYDSPSPPVSYESPDQSDMNDVPDPSHSYGSPMSTSDDSPPTSSYESPSPPPATTYGVEENHHKRLHKFKIIPVLVLFGFFMILLTWVFLRVGFFTQVGVAGNFRRSFDSFLGVLESWDEHPSLETLTGSVIAAITSNNGFPMADTLKKSR